MEEEKARELGFEPRDASDELLNMFYYPEQDKLYFVDFGRWRRFNQ